MKILKLGKKIGNLVFLSKDETKSFIKYMSASNIKNVVLDAPDIAGGGIKPTKP